MGLKIPIDPVALTEALPFLVCTVGFDKPLRLARAVFGHKHLLLPPGLEGTSTKSNANGDGNSLSVPNPQPILTSHHQLKPAPKIITESLSLVYAPIIRDYILEIAVLMVGAYSKVGGLKEVCALAALILAVDCLLLCTYLAAILGVMVEVSDVFFLCFRFLVLFISFSSRLRVTIHVMGFLDRSSFPFRPPGLQNLCLLLSMPDIDRGSTLTPCTRFPNPTVCDTP
jgi:hypothetical protein